MNKSNRTVMLFLARWKEKSLLVTLLQEVILTAISFWYNCVSWFWITFFFSFYVVLLSLMIDMIFSVNTTNLQGMFQFLIDWFFPVCLKLLWTFFALKILNIKQFFSNTGLAIFDQPEIIRFLAMVLQVCKVFIGCSSFSFICGLWFSF